MEASVRDALENLGLYECQKHTKLRHIENGHLIECLWFLCTRYGKLSIYPKARWSEAGSNEPVAKSDLRPERYA